MFKDSSQGTTHFENDGCGEPTHNQEYCEKSERVDGKKHSWVFDGDDPYVICAYCNERRDAISGKTIVPNLGSSFRDKEIVICAAVVAEDGRIFRGHRHNNCLALMAELKLKQRPDHEAQGFITSRNRYVDRREGLKIIKQAPQNTEVLPIDYMVLAGIFRNVAEQCIPKELIERTMKERFDAGKNTAEYELNKLTEQVKNFGKIIQDFETASGVHLHSWNGNEDAAKIGKVVKAILQKDERIEEAKKAIDGLKDRAANIIKFLDGEKQRWEL